MNNDFDVNREPTNGRGPVDFTVSFGSQDASPIEFKLAKSSSLKRHLERQVEIYEKANQTNPGKGDYLLHRGGPIETKAVLNELDLNWKRVNIAVDARQ